MGRAYRKKERKKRDYQDLSLKIILVTSIINLFNAVISFIKGL